MMALLGSILLSLCALPLALEAIRTKDMGHINTWFYWSWLIGEVFLAISYYSDPILMLNYTVNIIALLIIGRYKYVKRKTNTVI